MLLYRPMNSRDFPTETDTRTFLRYLLDRRQVAELQRLSTMLNDRPVQLDLLEFIDGKDVPVSIEEIMEVITERRGKNSDNCIFLTRKDIALDRQHYPYYGKYLCQEEGLLVADAEPFLWDTNRSIFCCCDYEKPIPAYTLNKLLVKKSELERLLAEEERRGACLSPNSLKTSVKNVLRRIELGVYDKIEKKSANREQKIQDLL